MIEQNDEKMMRVTEHVIELGLTCYPHFFSSRDSILDIWTEAQSEEVSEK